MLALPMITSPPAWRPVNRSQNRYEPHRSISSVDSDAVTQWQSVPPHEVVEEDGCVLGSLRDYAEVVDGDRPGILAGGEESECPEARELLGEARQFVKGRVDDDHLADPARPDTKDFGTALVGEHRFAWAQQVLAGTRSLAPGAFDSVLDIAK